MIAASVRQHGESAKELASALRLDERVLIGIDRLLFDYAEVGQADDVVIVFTPEVRDCAALVCLVLKAHGLDYSVVPMRALSDRGFQERLRVKVPKERFVPGRTVALVFEWETMSHNDVFRDVFAGHLPDQRRIVRCINAGLDLFSIGLQPLPSELSQRNADLLYVFQGASEFKIQTPAGTDLNIRLNPGRYDWISNRGMSEDGRMIALPAGEIATFPESISGTLVADFAINVNYRFDGDVRLHTCPVTVTIENNELVAWTCEDARIARQLNEFFMMSNATRVGELGFGTHPEVDAAVLENSHLNERRRGVHIGFGQHNQDSTIAGYKAQIHVDLIAAGGQVLVPGGRIVDLERVPRTDAKHPVLMKSIDVFSPDLVPPDISPADCCGLTCM
jgi:hypothetical protein